MQTTVCIHVIKVYDIVIEHEEGVDPISLAYDLDTLTIQEEGKLVSADTDFAEIVDSD